MKKGGPYIGEGIEQGAAHKYFTLLHNMQQGFCIAEVLFDETGKANDLRFLETNPVFEKQIGLHKVVGKTMKELQPAYETYWFGLYGTVAKARTSVHFEMETGRPGNTTWYDVYAVPFNQCEDNLIGIFFNDITDRKKVEGALRHSEEQKTFLLKLSDKIRPLADPEAIEEQITHTAMKHFGADRCYYCEIRNDHAIILRDAHRPRLQSVAGTYPLGEFVLFKTVIETGRTLVVQDIFKADYIDPQLKELCIHLQVISFLDVPVIKHGKMRGILCLVQSVPRKWKQIELELSEEIAERTWVAVERARTERSLYEAKAEKLRVALEEQQQQELFQIILQTQEDERRRISENLHHGLAQTLYGVKISLSQLTLKDAINHPKEYERSKLHTDKLLADAIRETRRISHELMPIVLEDYGLEAAIKHIFQQLKDGIKFRYLIKLEAVKLNKYVQLAVYRIIQELIVNVVRHAAATELRVEARAFNNDIYIEVEDNGIGMDLANQQEGGIGLASIRSKVDLLDGKYEIITAPGKGTCVKISLPYILS